ncbi:MAG: hypothetical protein JAY94_19650 [Candidatus Thiodiazotropha endolucinida]|nr:hypothetical protein [Candidatus Thiodiazotropha taylori]MCW4319735.1 hypothetical protein [Candidatus Thiodiazotropha taylori]
MWVVKFGGSLFDADNLKNWLALFANHSSLIIVPGGGPFADQVRLAQRQFGFDDSTAHGMALQAMEQYGRMLCGMQPGLSPAGDAETIYRTLERGDTPVWMPLRMALSDDKIEQNWQVTSDSLAAWLAGQLGIDKLLLIKSVEIGSNQLTSDWLQNNQIVDSKFADYVRKYDPQTWLLGRMDLVDFDRLLSGRMEELSSRVVRFKPTAAAGDEVS